MIGTSGLWTKGHHPLNLFPRPWTLKDRLAASIFPRRKATVLPSVWVEELMAKRFGALMICQPCEWKYRDGIRRWGYAKHPDMKAAGNACDFCKQVRDWLPLWMKEEHRYPTRQDHYDQSQRYGINTAQPHLFDRRRMA